jgi:VWFA-related protein
MRLRHTAVRAVVALITAGHATAAPAPPRFETGVTLVTLSAFVTDREGKAIPGLAAADFEVLDDGKPAAIVQFQEVDALARVPAAAGGSWAIQAASRRQFLFLFDLSFSHPAGIVRARKAARRLAESGLAASDLAGVATFSIRRGMRMLLGLTTDRQQLARAIEMLDVLDVERAPDALALTYELGSGSEPPRSERKPGWEEHLAAQGALMAGGEAALYSHGVASFLSGVEQIAQVLGAVRGRKQVVLLSAGYSDISGAGAGGGGLAAAGGSIGVFDIARLRRLYDAITRAFAAADAVVHTVDVSGLFAPGDIGAPFRIGGGSRVGSGRESLRQISMYTGGQWIKDSNDIEGALREVIDRSRHYYVIAIEPAAKGEGKHHKLRVRTRVAGATVSHRKGYVERGVAAVLDAEARRIQAAEAIAKGLSGGDLILRAVAVPYRDAEGRSTLPVTLELDGPSVLGSRSSGTLSLEIYGYAFDEKEYVVDTMTLTPTLDLATIAPRLREGGLQFHTAFVLPPGTADLRFLVHDVSTGRTGALRVEVAVPSFAPDTIALSPPLVRADVRPVLVKAPSRSVSAPEMPCRVGDDVLVPQALPRLSNGRTASVCVLAFSPTPFDAKSSFEISAHLLDASAARVPLGAPPVVAAVVGEADGFRRFLLKLTPTGVAPGDYTLHVRLKDPLVSEAVESSQPVRID